MSKGASSGQGPEPTTIVGVDVGGTKVSVATLRGGNFGEPRIAPTAHGSTEQFIGEVVHAVHAAAGGISRRSESVCRR